MKNFYCGARYALRSGLRHRPDEKRGHRAVQETNRGRCGWQEDGHQPEVVYPPGLRPTDGLQEGTRAVVIRIVLIFFLSMRTHNIV